MTAYYAVFLYMCMFPCFFSIVFLFFFYLLSLLCVFVYVLFISTDLRGLIQIKKEKKERISSART